MTAISATSVNNYSVAEQGAAQSEQSQGAHNVESISYTSTQDGSSGSGGSSDFATVFSNAIVDEQAQLAAAIGTSGAFSSIGASTMPGMGMMTDAGMMPGLDAGFGSSMMEQAFMNTASSADTSSEQMAQIMLMMMMFMMQNSGGGGDMSMLPMMISALLPQLDNSAQNFNNDPHNLQMHNPQMNAPFAAPMNSRFGIETNSSGGMTTSSIAGFGSATLPLNVGIAATPVITSNIHNRSPERYRAIVDQFQVETAERYRPGRDGFTYCNIFVLDVVRAMGAHIPHLGAINMCNWLGTTGRQYGWREVDAATAQVHANMGRPAVTSAGSIGHVQMVVPSRTPFNPERGVSIAQAGRINTNYAPISTIYGGNTLHTRIRYFVHD